MAQKEVETEFQVRDFVGCDILSVEQFDQKNLAFLFALADKMRGIIVEKREDNRLSGHIFAILSWSEGGIDTELLAFQAAIKRLGGNFILDSVYEEAKDYYHQIASLENLGNTIRLIESLGVDAIILKHSEDGAAKLATEFASIPIINTGGESNQNPTQVLANLYGQEPGCGLYIRMALLAGVLGKI